MTQSIGRGFFFPLLLLVWGAASSWGFDAAAAGTLECPICGMHFKATARTSFLAQYEKKPLNLCSFACATKLSDRQSGATFQVLDFASGNLIDAEKAFFLIKSKNLLKELEFDMPPSVVAFAQKAQAQAKQKAIGDGEVINGWKDLKKNLAP